MIAKNADLMIGLIEKCKIEDKIDRIGVNFEYNLNIVDVEFEKILNSLLTPKTIIEGFVLKSAKFNLSYEISNYSINVSYLRMPRIDILCFLTLIIRNL